MGRMTRLANVGFWISAGVTLLVTRPVMATLGQYQDSVETDRSVISGVRHQSTTNHSFSIHEIANDGISVREYARPDGIIFALSWAGDTHPDLSKLLGTYFADYTAASKRAPKVRGRRPYSLVQGQTVTVEKSGHQRALRGRACVTNLLPSGVSCDEIN